MGKLTKRDVERAKPGEKRYQMSDGDGLCLWVYPNGRRVWISRYRRPADKVQDYYTHPTPYPDATLAQAREFNRDVKALLARGINPKSHFAAERAANAGEPTFDDVVDRWLQHVERAGELAPKTLARHRWRWEAYLRKHLGALRVRDLTRAHLAAALDATRRRSREETRKALSTLNMALDFALARHLIDENPARVLRPKDFAATTGSPRDRVLSVDELQRVWLAFEEACSPEASGARANGGTGKARTATVHPATAAAVKVLIATGARRAEVAGMRWDELNGRSWRLPPSRTKNGRGHLIYLSEPAADAIETMRPLNGASAFVFSTRDPEKPLHPDSLTTAIGRMQEPATGTRAAAPLSGLAAFAVHDLRRSAATAWGEHLGAPPDLIERMLNHLPADKLVRTYQHQRLADDQRRVWEAWGRLLAGKLEAANVVQLAG